MPNHTSNNIIFEKQLTNEEIQKIKDELFNRNKNLDFNKLVPQPENIILTDVSSNTKEAYSWYFAKNPDNLTKEELLKTLKSETKRDEIEKKYNLITREEKYSIKESPNYECLPDWYDWNIENWGTKWGAYNTTIESNILFFNTAWNMPSYEVVIKLFEKLKAMLPKETFDSITYEVTNEGESFTEIYKYVDGSIEFKRIIEEEA